MIIFELILKISKKIRQDKIFVYSSHASFYLLISAIPFATLLIALIKQFLFITEYDINAILLPFFPKATHDVAESIIKEVFYKTDGVFLSISLFSLLWTASRGISAIRRGVFIIYGLSERNFIADILSGIALMLVLIIVMLALAGISVFLTAKVPEEFTGIIALPSLAMGFSFIYFLLSQRKFPFKSHLPGAVFSSVSWFLFIRIFSFYVKHFSSYSSLFGSLTAIFILALWVNFSTIIFFFGAELNIMISKGFFKVKKAV